MNKPQLFKILTIVALFLLLMQATAYVPSQTSSPNYNKRITTGNILNYNKPSDNISPKEIPEWWNNSWHYRLYLNVSFSYSSDVNYSVYVVVNFTKEMEQITTNNKTIDVNSIRVVEYNADTGDIVAEVPSKFVPFSSWNPDTNAVGAVLFLVTAPIQANVNRTYHIYFDTTFFGPKEAPVYSEVFDAYWEQFYPLASDGSYSTPDQVPYVSPPYVERQHTKIYYSDSGSYPGDSYPSEVTNLDRFCGNWTTWLYVNTSGNFGFRLYSDDGSWLLLNDSIVVDNGGNHAPRSVSNTIYLSEGIYKLTVKWYERGGAAVTHLYWTYPGESEELLTTSIHGFEGAKLMDYSALPTRTLGNVETSFLLTVTAVDKSYTPVESTDVLVYNATATPEELLFSTTTDENGKAYLTLTSYGTYRIVVRNETAYPTWSTEKIWVENNSYTITINESNIFSKVNKTIVLPLSTIDLLVTDLNGNPMRDSSMETTEVLLFNTSQVNMIGVYLHTNGSGYVRFYRLPSDNYFVKFRYTSNYYNVFYDETIMGSDGFSAQTSGVRTVTIGVTTVNVHVVSVDYYSVSPANVTLANDASAPTFLQYNTTLENGIASFYHVLNGTWYISASYTNPFGQHIENNTVQMNFQSDNPKYLVLNITHFHIITVDQATNATLVGTNVSIYEVGNPNLVMSLSTNSSGWASFYFVLCGTYNITANYQGNKNTTTPLQAVISETELIVEINVQYTTGNSYLFAKSNAISFVSWNDNITLLVNYSYWNGSAMVPITSPDWLNFTVNLGSTSLYTGTIDEGWVINNTDGTYTLLINTSALSMYPSETYYTIIVRAKDTGHADPYPILYTIQVSSASTNVQSSKTSINVNWTDTTVFTVQYTDTTHGLPIAYANVTYSVYNSTHDLMFTTTITSATNTYTITIPTEVHDLTPGDYSIEIFVGKKGYVNKTITVSLTVVDTATQLQLVTSEPINVTWGQSIDISSRYLSAVNSSDIKGADVFVILNDTYVYNLTYNSTTGHYDVTFNSSELFSGVYLAEIHASREYYTSQVYSFKVYVNPVPMHYVFVSGVNASYNVTWTDILELKFYIQTNTTSHNITTASVELTWSPILHKNIGVFNETSKLYIVVVNTSEVYTGKYNITLTAQLTNYTRITYQMSININEVPTDIVGPDNITVVWNHNLELSIYYIDTYHNDSGIPNAMVTITFGGQTNIMNMLSPNGTYYLSIPTNLVDPGVHNLTIVAQKQNYQLVTKVINVTVLVPVRMTAEDIVGYWGTEVLVTVNVTNTFNNTNVENGSVLLNVGDVEIQLVSAGNGTYTGTLDLGNFKTEMPYTMTITFVKDMYEQARITRSLYVNLVPTALEILSWIPGTANYSIEEGTTNNVTVIVFYNNTLTGNGISNAHLYAIWGNNTYNLTEIGSGEYRLYLDISNLTASPNPYTIEIHATKGNYTESVTTFTFTIYESTITIPGTNIKVPRSIVMTGVGGSVISVTAFGAALYGYRLYKIPKIIRQLDKIIKLVAKGQTPDFSELPTTEQMLKDALGGLFTSLPGTEIDKLIKKEA